MRSSSRREGEEREEALRPAFKIMDTDGDGRIGRDDLKRFFSTAVAAPPGEEEAIIRSMIVAADADHDGYVAFDEFERILRREDDGGIMEEIFRKMDCDGDGILGFEDLKEYMNWAGLFVSGDEITAMISLAGGGGGEGVGFPDFLKILDMDLA